MKGPGKGKYSEVRQDWQIMDKESWGWLRRSGRETLVEVRSETSWMRRAHRGLELPKAGNWERPNEGGWVPHTATPRIGGAIVRRSYNRSTAVICCEKWESQYCHISLLSISTSKWSLGCRWRHTEPLVGPLGPYPSLPRNTPLLSPGSNPSSTEWISPEMDTFHNREDRFPIFSA